MQVKNFNETIWPCFLYNVQQHLQFIYFRSLYILGISLNEPYVFAH